LATEFLLLADWLPGDQLGILIQILQYDFWLTLWLATKKNPL